MKKIIEIIDLSKLQEFAKDLSIKISSPFFIGLEGEMGAGKTTFTQALVNELFQEDKIVNSPTFSIINLYENNRKKIVHMDLFRLETYDDLIFSGVDEYLFDKESIIIAEWYNKVIFDIPKPNLLINIEIISLDKRKFTIIENI